MKAAIASRTPVVGVLTLLALTALVDNVAAQGAAERAPATAAPNLTRRPEPLPPAPRAERQENDAPSVSEEPPPAARGCPDHGRKLELIV